MAFQLAFYFQFPTDEESRAYSAFLQNVIMSIMFIEMLFRRGRSEGQSMTIAVCKCIGTIAPTILIGYIWSFNIYVLIFGAFCCLFDIIYIILLRKQQIKENMTNLQKII